MASYRAESAKSFIDANGNDVQQYFADLGADPTTTNGLAVSAATLTGVVTIPMTNILGVVKST